MAAKMVIVITLFVVVVCGQNYQKYDAIDSIYHNYVLKTGTSDFDKQEFETTAMYKMRVKNSTENIIKGMVFTFKADRINLSYDADLSVFRGYIVNTGQLGHAPVIPLLSLSYESSSTDFTNTFGAVISGTTTRIEYIAIESKGYDIVEVSVPLNEAKSFKINGSVIFKYRVTNCDSTSVFQKYSQYYEATFSSPHSRLEDYTVLLGDITDVYAIDTLTRAVFPVAFKQQHQGFMGDRKKDNKKEDRRNRSLIGLSICGAVAIIIGTCVAISPDF